LANYNTEIFVVNIRGQVSTFNKVGKEIENNIVKYQKTSFLDIFDLKKLSWGAGLNN
jgi:hypothetical protein